MSVELKDWLDIIFKGVTAVVVIYGAYKSRNNSKAIEVVSDRVEVVHDAVNGQGEKIVKVEKALSRKEGIAIGIAREKERDPEK